MPTSSADANAAGRSARVEPVSLTDARFGEQLRLFESDELLAEVRADSLAAAPLRRTA